MCGLLERGRNPNLLEHKKLLKGPGYSVGLTSKVTVLWPVAPPVAGDASGGRARVPPQNLVEMREQAYDSEDLLRHGWRSTQACWPAASSSRARRVAGCS